MSISVPLPPEVALLCPFPSSPGAPSEPSPTQQWGPALSLRPQPRVQHHPAEVGGGRAAMPTAPQADISKQAGSTSSAAEQALSAAPQAPNASAAAQAWQGERPSHPAGVRPPGKSNGSRGRCGDPRAGLPDTTLGARGELQSLPSARVTAGLLAKSCKGSPQPPPPSPI